MTTIAYNHKDKEIAFDSRLTRGSTIASDNYNKAIKKSGLTFILAGSTSDCDLVASMYPDRLTREVDCYGFLIDSGVVYWVSSDDLEIKILELSYNEAAGSGQDHALTAMDLGLSAKDSVKMSAKRDSNTGGKIRVIKVK